MKQSNLFKQKRINQTVYYNVNEVRDVYVEVYYGKTGTGKTRTAYELYPNAYFMHECDIRWWDGYDGNNTIIIDMFDSNMNIEKLLKILNGSPIFLPMKRGCGCAQWNRVIITSFEHPDNWYSKKKDIKNKDIKNRINMCINSIRLFE